VSKHRGNSRLVLACSLALVLAGAHPAAAEQPQRVTVTTSSGRTFTGVVDSRTDDAMLWLRSEKSTMAVCRPIAWGAILSATMADEVLSAAALREIAPGLRSARVRNWTTLAEPPVPETVTDPGMNALSSGLPVVVGFVAEAPRESARVRSIQIDGGLAHTGGGVDADSLVLTLSALDGYGMLVPVSGTLEVELIGEGPPTTAARETFPLLGRWSRPVLPEDFGPSGAVYRLEMQTLHPEFDLRLGSLGVVHARLTVPGQGTFEASSGATRLRSSNVVRDHLQLQQNTRFFPNERTSRPQQPAPMSRGL
jgi:hypothetical protein